MKIGIIGLGLIGGSIFKKLKDEYEVVGISRSVNEFGIDNNYTRLKDCDLIFVCTPMNKTLEILEKLENYTEENTVVTDVCSLKEFVSKKNYKYKFIPSHPMAGTEHSGWEHSFPELFEGATWAVTPKQETTNEDLEILSNVIKFLGAKPLITNSKEHDKAVAMISHAPMVVAQALCKNILDNKLAQQLASSGFRDTTRLALSNLEMANDMVKMNNDNIRLVIEMLKNNIDDLLKEDYKSQAKEIKDFRQKLY